MLQAIYDSVDPIAFSVGPFDVRWYGLAYLAGFVVCALVAYRIAKRWKTGMTKDDMMVLLVAIMVGTILGARLGYVLFYGNGYYLQHPGQILAFQNGGMSFHGGLIGMVFAGIVAAKITKISYLTLADLVAIVVPIGLFFGRCANFINGELWGAETTLPWGVVFEDAGPNPHHPSQLYEAMLEGIVLFIILYLLSHRKPPFPRGSYLAIFLMGYGVFRFLIEFVRQPDAHIGYLAGGWLTMGMVLSIPLIVTGVLLLVWSRKKGLPQEVPGVAEDAPSGRAKS